MLRSIGVASEGPTLTLGDNMLMALNTLVPSRVIKIKHNALAYHQVVRSYYSFGDEVSVCL
jgi:hypothetical protein